MTRQRQKLSARRLVVLRCQRNGLSAKRLVSKSTNQRNVSEKSCQLKMLSANPPVSKMSSQRKGLSAKDVVSELTSQLNVQSAKWLSVKQLVSVTANIGWFTQRLDSGQHVLRFSKPGSCPVNLPHQRDDWRALNKLMVEDVQHDMA